MVPINPISAIKLGVVAIFISSLGFSYTIHQKNQGLKKELTIEQLKVLEYSNQIAVLAQARADDQKMILEHSVKINKVEKRYKDAITVLEAQKQKKKALLSKPGLVSNHINASSQRLFLELSCLSGDAASCDDTPTSPTTNNPD